MREMVLEVSELHDPREPAGRSWGFCDPAHIYLVGLGLVVRQQLEGPQFSTSQACAA
jgi:hypothetical protein